MRQKAFVTLIGGADSANNSIFRQKKSAPTVKQVREIGDSCQILETGTGISKTLSNKKIPQSPQGLRYVRGCFVGFCSAGLLLPPFQSVP